MTDELLDIVSGHDEVTGTIYRNDYEQLLTQPDSFIRASELFIMNDAGELWIPVRPPYKKIAPNAYDYSAGGHVESGEDYMQTIIRETQEETNVIVTAGELEFVAKLKSVDIRYIRNVYLFRTNQTPEYNPEDFVSAEWLTPAALIANIDAGRPAKSNLRGTVVTLQTYLSGK